MSHTLFHFTTPQLLRLHSGKVRDSYRITRVNGMPVERPESESQLSAEAIELGNYRHYMQKEIFEQPVALANTLEMLGSARSIQPGIFGAESETILGKVQQVLIIACGTSYHAGLVARYWLESIAATHFGLLPVLSVVAFFPLLAGLVGFALPSSRRPEAITTEPLPVPAPVSTASPSMSITARSEHSETPSTRAFLGRLSPATQTLSSAAPPTT